MITREFLWATALLCCAGCAACAACAGEVQAARELPAHRDTLPPEGAQAAPRGVVLVTVDTLRADYLSLYGHARVLTPSFDRLAAGGVVFRQAIAQSTTTTPSHATIMTSLYLQDHNVYTNFDAIGDDPKTLAEVLHDDGYATYAIVNMRHLNPEVANLTQGFERFEPCHSVRRAGDVVDHFLAWLGEIGDRKFFAWLHLADVHTPYRPPPPYDRFYYDDDESDPRKQSLSRIWPLLPTHMSDHPHFQAWLAGITDLKWVFAQYQGAVTYVDDELGRLLDALERRGLIHRTGVVVTADHGESLGEHDMYFVHTGLYEPTVHVPLITYFPGVEVGRRGREVRSVVEHVDVMPTILEYLSVAAPRRLRGRSLWPLIRGELQPERVALTEHAGHNLVALRTDRYKYIKHLRSKHLQPSYPFVEGKEELYDLAADPLERTDQSAQMPEIVRVFRRELAARRDDRLDLTPGAPHVTEETLEVLRALGYVR